MSKYTYFVETYYIDRWLKLFSETRDYCLGYLSAIADRAPRNPYRVVRSDGKVVQDLPGNTEVSIGQIAGWPTPEQYESAAKRAMEQAALIREWQRSPRE